MCRAGLVALKGLIPDDFMMIMTMMSKKWSDVIIDFIRLSLLLCFDPGTRGHQGF